jgi:tetratricopeptide (TPR) repeat protein
MAMEQVPDARFHARQFLGDLGFRARIGLIHDKALDAAPAQAGQDGFVEYRPGSQQHGAGGVAYLLGKPHASSRFLGRHDKPTRFHGVSSGWAPPGCVGMTKPAIPFSFLAPFELDYRQEAAILDLAWVAKAKRNRMAVTPLREEQAMTAKLLRTRLSLLLLVSALLAACAGLTLQSEIDGLMKEGQQLYAEKKYDQAIDKFVIVIGKDPTYWQAYLWAARAFIAKGDWGDAIANGRKAFELAPNKTEAIPIFAQALFGGGTDALKNGRFAESVSLFVEYLKLEPGNTQAWLNVGKAYLGQKDFRQALGAFAQGLAAGGGAERQELIRELLDGGLQAFSSGKYRESIDLLQEYLKYDKNLQALLGIAKAYWEAGDKGKALDAFKQVLQLDPRQEEALRYMLRR